jgi:hypothetical protein
MWAPTHTQPALVIAKPTIDEFAETFGKHDTSAPTLRYDSNVE